MTNNNCKYLSSGLLVQFPYDSFECCKVWSVGRVFSPTSFH